ncbi:hypothetical protein DSO57_1026866 [Entomophthora muscae]|uniref:Uncharacterized protein n=2 Tax=Entomophthora muscae TaxID=34485 RepID=A0ACC2RUY6_9FUNG|nr:hypothetical protein DSO57_1020763 [Entomophthora muscae]KAJ9068608.1 hypothetical protein DSO57_1026866 [Entomophthora muscae]
MAHSSLNRRQANKEFSLINYINESNRLSQCIFTALYFLTYSYYIDFKTSSFVELINPLFTLSTFICALLLSDDDTFVKASPYLASVLASIPGLPECISLLVAVVWMVIALTWFLLFPEPQLSATFLETNLPYILSSLAFLNWTSWTCSFMF